MIEVRGLSKSYGSTKAVDDLSFEVRPGVVTGFLGPNGGQVDDDADDCRTGLLTTLPTRSALSPWAGLAVLSLYAATALTAATILITRRDV